MNNKHFNCRILAVALPMMIQNGITNFVQMLDNVMVGQVGTIPMSGVAIVNQLMFVFNLCIFGAASGAGIFTAQFRGREDHEGIRHTFRFKILVGMLLSALGAGIFLTFGRQSFSSKEQGFFNFMAAVTICSDFGAQENKVCHCFHCFPIYLP